MKALLFGFSVTEDKFGYSLALTRQFNADPTAPEVEVFGIGGLPHEPLPALLDKALAERGPFTHVFVEICTSGFTRGRPVTPETIDVIYDLVHRIQSHGAKAAFINLYREDFDYDYHPFDMVIEAIAKRHDIWLLDLGYRIMQQRGRRFFDDKLRDVTHVNPNGAAFQLEEISRFVRNVIASDRRQLPVPAPREQRRFVSFTDLTDAPTDELLRSDIVWPHILVSEGETLTVNLPATLTVTGFSYVCGPQAGPMFFFFDDANEWTEYPGADEHSYYSRFHYWDMEPVTCQRLAVKQLPVAQGLRLAKGELDPGPRVGRLIGLHYRTS